jgi:hypothetical protein
VVTVRGKVGAEEEVTMLQGRQRLLRIEAAPDKVEYAGGSVELPGLVAWLDKKGTIVRRQMELPGLGQVISYRTSREMALAQGPLTRLDIGEKTFIPLNRGLSQPHRTGNVVYRIRLKGEKDLSTAIAQDARQEIKNLKDNTFELHVRALRSPEEVADPTARTKEEFLNSCYFLKCDDPRVQALTRQAVDGTTDPLKKARRIERWVHENMRHDNRSNFAPADEVARTLKGDCRQHALLTAAMCRAAGVPSRTAVGLVYGTDANRRPVMAFHMWTEVWVKGQWFAIDATLGQGSIGAAHIKIADHSWYDTQSLTPLLPVVRVLGKMEIEVVSVNGMPGGMKEEG